MWGIADGFSWGDRGLLDGLDKILIDRHRGNLHRGFIADLVFSTKVVFVERAVFDDLRCCLLYTSDAADE